VQVGFDHPNESRNNNTENMLHHGDFIWLLQRGKAMGCELFGSLAPLLCQFPVQGLTYIKSSGSEKTESHTSLFH